jgi:hypothetical protein
MKRLILCAAALLATPAAAKPVSFAADIAPTLKTRCAVCHLTGQEAGNLALHPKAAYASLFRRKSGEGAWLLVDPKKPDASYLVMKLEGTHLKRGGKGARMPFAAPPLDPPTIALIRRWISEGAPNN